MSVIEGLASGATVVAMDTPLNRELIGEAPNVRLITADEISHLAEIADNLALSITPAERVAGIDFARSRFSEATMIRAHLRLLS